MSEEINNSNNTNNKQDKPVIASIRNPSNPTEYETTVASYIKQNEDQKVKTAEWRNLAVQKDREILILNNKLEEANEKLQVMEINNWKNKDFRSSYSVRLNSVSDNSNMGEGSSSDNRRINDIINKFEQRNVKRGR